MAISTKMECDYLNGWIKNGHIGKNLTKKGEPQRYSWECKRKRRMVAINMAGINNFG